MPTSSISSIPNQHLLRSSELHHRGTFVGHIPDGNSHGSSSKHSDSMSDDLTPQVQHSRFQPNGGGSMMMAGNSIVDNGKGDSGHIPYDVLLHDLTQAKRQLIDLQTLVSIYTWQNTDNI